VGGAVEVRGVGALDCLAPGAFNRPLFQLNVSTLLWDTLGGVSLTCDKNE